MDPVTLVAVMVVSGSALGLAAMARDVAVRALDGRREERQARTTELDTRMRAAEERLEEVEKRAREAVSALARPVRR